MDDYVQGVVPAEMPASWEPEAVQAQAVAARTYAAWHRARSGDRYYQICDTTSCQVYGGRQRRARARQRRGAGDGAADPDLRRRAGVHPVLRQLGRLDRPPATSTT